MQQGALIAGLHVALGKYELVRPLARGAMGEVWIARHRTLGRDFAIKFLRREVLEADPDAEDERNAMARFRFEAQVAAALSRKSRHIVAVTDHGEELGYAYLVMELVEGDSLSSILHAHRRLELEWVAAVVAQVGKGLSVAHAEGVFHRDLKPANVVLARDEDGSMLAKILDFGIAKAARSHRVHGGDGAQHPTHETEVGVVLGTPNYMSPEQARGLSSLDHRCDVWALATIAFEALTGELPYDGETTADLLVNICMAPSVPIRRLRPELPATADVVFARAFARHVDDRFPTAAAFADALASVAAEARGPASVVATDGAGESPTLETVVTVLERRGRARTMVAVALSALAVLATSGLLAHLARARRADDAPSAPTRAASSHVEEPPAPTAIEPAAAVASASSEPEARPSASLPRTSAPPRAQRATSRAPQRTPATKPSSSATAIVTTPTSTAPATPSATEKPIDKGEIL